MTHPTDPRAKKGSNMTQTDALILTFCAKQDSRYSIKRPFVKDGWEYATDGRWLVRRKTDRADEGNGPPAADLFARASIGEAIPYPAALPEPHFSNCDQCGVPIESAVSVLWPGVACIGSGYLRKLMAMGATIYRRADGNLNAPMRFSVGELEGLLMPHTPGLEPFVVESTGAA